MSLSEKVLARSEKRGAVLYVRVKQDNKDFVECMAEDKGVGASVIVDELLDQMREDFDRHHRQPRKRAAKA